MGAISNRTAAEAGFDEATAAPLARTPPPFSAAAIRATKASAPPEPVVLGERAMEAANRYATQVISASMLAGLWRIVEFLCLASISLAVIAVYDMPGPAHFARYAVISVCGALAGISMIQAFGGYDPAAFRKILGQVVPVAIGWAVALAALALGFFFLRFQNELSRVWLALWYACGLGTLGMLRVLLGLKIRTWRQAGRMERRAVIVGGGPAAEELINEINREPNNDLKICGIFDDRDDRRSPASVAGCPKLGNVRQLVEFARRTHIDMLIVTIPLTAEKRVLELLKTLWVLPVDIRLSSHSSQMRFPSRSLSYVGRVPLLEVFDRPITEWNSIAKRLFDIVIAGTALVVLSPVLAATAIAIKLDSRGPILFRQKRHGFNNQIIDVLKFRSMYHEMADPAAVKVVTRGDARVTPVGRFIRKTSLDELPQLWNVLRGDLSLVGPRPHAVHARSSTNEAFIEIVDDYFGRHRVKPGITGWAQINGFRGEIDHPDKLKSRFDYDLEYIDKWSILFDIKILARTPLCLFSTENAY